ncbi:MAG: beta-ketoacyl synthase N-terminal-like domain-containing protein [Thermodesulfobacteriota bacterium]
MSSGQRQEHDAIAIVGMACVFPGATDLSGFWHNVVNGTDAISEPPAGNMLHRVYDPESRANDRVYSKRGGFLHRLPPFVPSEFGVMPRAIDGAEPEHFIALQTAHAALVDAGFPDLPINRERTEVIIGRGTYVNRGFMTAMQHAVVVDQTVDLLRQLHPEHNEEELQRLRAVLKEQLPPFSPETAPGLCHNLVAGLIANRLDLHGRNLVMDAACASCLLALEIAADDLTSGKCDAAIVGGIQVSTHAPIHMIFAQLGALSRQAHLRPFDRCADGTMLGEGVGMVVLKRLADAVADGHRIYAVIRGVGSSSDGRGSGLLAPRQDGEELALRRAYRTAKLAPDTVGLIEAHGTGIPLGDATEIRALAAVFGSARAERAPCAVGTVKSMIGHLIPAAGIAGVIKAALALYHKVLPPTLCCDEVNPELAIERTPFYINTTTRPWIHGSDAYPRRAGVNAFGFGGINAHVVLEEHGSVQLHADLSGDWDAELVVLTGGDRQELAALCTQTVRWLESPAATGIRLMDLAATLAERSAGRGCRLAVIAGSCAELAKKLGHAGRLLADPARRQIKDRSGIFYFDAPLAVEGKLAFLFPGEGSQYVDMLADICRAFPAARRCFDLLDRAYADRPGGELPSFSIFPPPGSAGAEERLFAMEGAVDAVSTANRALFTLFTDLGVRPDAVLGHSSGELAALEAAGAVRPASDDEVLDYIRIGNRIIGSMRAADDIPHGRLLAVGGIDKAAVDETVAAADDFLTVAMRNCPHQFVLCGTDATVAAAEQSLRARGAICQQLPFQRAYHTERFRPALARLAELYRHADFVAPAVSMYSCLTAAPLAGDPETIRAAALEQWVKPVRFQETVERMYADGIRLFVEVGPRANLTGFVADTLKDRPHAAIAANVHHRSGVRQLLFCLAMLAAHGVKVDLEKVYGHRAVRRVDLGSMQPAGVPAGMELDRQLPILQLQPATVAAIFPNKDSAGRVPNLPFAVPDVPAVATGAPALAAYFQTMEHFLEVQRQVMTAALDSAGQLTVPPPPATAPSLPPAKTVAAVADPSQSLPASQQSLRSLLLKLASERTGYPVEMLGLDQDMEAELGIDSIKRVEILGALTRELGLPAEGSGEEVNRLRTLAAIIDFFEQKDGTPPTPATGTAIPRQAITAAMVDVKALLLRLVSERTGYPAEMLGLDQDMEAELGIDSIKRVEILGALTRELGLPAEGSGEEVNRLRTLASIITFFKRPPPAPTDGKHPLLDSVAFEDNGRLRATAVLDLDRDRYLRDHTLGGSVSRQDPELHGLAVLPFAMGLELLAAAARPLFFGGIVAGFRDVRALDWITIPDRTLPLSLLAERREGADGALVRLFVGEAGADREALRGTVLFADALPPPSSPPVARQGQWHRDGIPDALYPGVLFHGPIWRGIDRIDSWGESGAEATLRVAQPLLPQGSAPLLVAPQMLDGAGQVVGAWASRFVAEQYVIFPVVVEAIDFSAGRDSDSLVCRTASIADRDSIRSEVSLEDASGANVCRISGLRHKRIDMPELIHHFRSSREVLLSREWQVDLPIATDAAVVCLFAADSLSFAGADGRVLREVIARIILNRRERQTWRELAFPEERRSEWLLGRLVAKEAVRRLLQKRGLPDIWPADLEIAADDHGRPQLIGPDFSTPDRRPLISLSHSGGNAAAIAVWPQAAQSVGIDIEAVRELADDFAGAAFAPEEREWLDRLPAAEKSAWLLPLWCGREAVVKAMGGRGNSVVCREKPRHDDVLQFRVDGGDPHNEQPVSALTWRREDLIGAVCLIDKDRQRG